MLHCFCVLFVNFFVRPRVALVGILRLSLFLEQAHDLRSSRAPALRTRNRRKETQRKRKEIKKKKKRQQKCKKHAKNMQ